MAVIQVDDLMVELARCRDDAEGIQRFNELVFGTPLHPGQLDWVLRAKKQVNLLSPGNSWGKTEVIAREAVRHSWYKLGLPLTPEEWLTAQYNVLVCSFNYDIANESFDRLKHLWLQGGPLGFLIEKVYDSEPHKIKFTNSSVCDWGSLAEDGRLIEATRRHKIFVDEVGQEPGFEQAYNDVIYPRTIGVNGTIDLIGTPKPKTDPFVFEIFELGSRGDEFYFAKEGSSFENIYWPENERKRVMANPKLVKPDGALTELGEQVINGRFRIAGGLFFNRLRVARIFTGDWPLLDSKEEGRYYLVACDLGGRKKTSDATVIMALDITELPWRLKFFRRFEGAEADWEDKYEAIREAYEEFLPPYTLVDVTGSTRDSIAEQLELRGVPVEGVQFGGAQGGKKYNYLRSLQSAMEMDWVEHREDGGSVAHRGYIRCPNVDLEPGLRQLKHELDFYQLKDEKLTQDCVMTLAMLVHWAMLELVPEPMTGEAY
jgi:hypothetical protein